MSSFGLFSSTGFLGANCLSMGLSLCGIGEVSGSVGAAFELSILSCLVLLCDVRSTAAFATEVFSVPA